MRQEHYKTRLSHPLLFTTGNKLIDNNLGTVREITKLGFPEDQSVRVVKTVSQFVTKLSVLRQARVGNCEDAFSSRDVVERDVAIVIQLVVKDDMAMRESSTLNILSREANIEALQSQGAKSKSLSSGPVDVLGSS